MLDMPAPITETKFKIQEIKTWLNIKLITVHKFWVLKGTICVNILSILKPKEQLLKIQKLHNK